MKKIGIIGATGTVGQHVAHFVAELEPSLSLVLGGRNKLFGNTIVDDLPCEAIFLEVDCYQTESLDDFIQHCDVVCSCVGPSDIVKDVIALAALKARKAYVDVAGESALVQLVKQQENEWKNYAIPAVLGAGMLPGLSGILPLWFGTKISHSNSVLRFFYFGREPFSPSAAYDFVASINDSFEFNPPTRHEAVLRNVKLEGLDDICTAVPVHSVEAQIASRVLHREVIFYNCFIHDELFVTLCGLQRDLPLTESTKKKWADKLISASKNGDCFSHHIFHCQEEETNASLTTCSCNGAKLTAIAAAITIVELVKQKIPSGVHYFCEAVSPETVMQVCDKMKIIKQLTNEICDNLFDEGSL